MGYCDYGLTVNKPEYWTIHSAEMLLAVFESGRKEGLPLNLRTHMNGLDVSDGKLNVFSQVA